METERATRWLSRHEQHAWRTYLVVTRNLALQLEREMRPFGLTLSDYEILVNLSEAAGRRMRMNALASATSQSRSRLSHQITRMENAGLVQREACLSDGRGLYATLTDRGTAALDTAAPHHAAAVRRHFIDPLSHDALADLDVLLTPVARHLRDHRARR